MAAKKHWLGNLTFFGPKDNSAAGNKPFATKKTSNYSSSEIGMTADLAALGQWTTSEFETREQDLLDNAIRVFVV